MTAFQKIYEEYAKPVYRFLLSLTGKEDLAEELLSETFYQAFRHIDTFEGRCSLYTWLCQIGKNAWLKECRRNRRYSTLAVEDLTLPDDGPSPEERLVTKESYCEIIKAMQRLPEMQRDVFILHALGDVKLREIAAMYGKTESWARVTYYRARQQIMQEVLA